MTPAARIGMFMLMGMIILGVFIIKIEDIPVGERGERTVVTARFSSVAGLDRKAAVRIAGVRVGKVDAISLDGSAALLTLSLDPQVQLHQGASAQIASLGMLGDRYIEILPGDPSLPLLPDGFVLGGAITPTFDDVLRVATEIGADVKEVTVALRGSIGGTQGEEAISEIVANIRDLTASLKVLIAENQANVNETTANFADFSATLRDELPKITEKMNLLADQLNGVVGENRDDLQASMANIRELTDRLQVSAENLNEITGKISSGEGTIGKLVNDETTVDNFNSTLDSIEDGIGTLNETMGRYRRYELQVALRAEALPSTDQSRTAFGFDLWTTKNRFFRIEGVDMPYGRVRTDAQYVTTTYPRRDRGILSPGENQSRRQDRPQRPGRIPGLPGHDRARRADRIHRRCRRRPQHQTRQAAADPGLRSLRFRSRVRRSRAPEIRGPVFHQQEHLRDGRLGRPAGVRKVLSPFRRRHHLGRRRRQVQPRPRRRGPQLRADIG